MKFKLLFCEVRQVSYAELDEYIYDYYCLWICVQTSVQKTQQLRITVTLMYYHFATANYVFLSVMQL